MDYKISKKARRYQPDGPVDVLVSNVCDLYPIFADDPKFADTVIYEGHGDRSDVIMDVEMLDDERDELLDRAMFAVMKQRGGDPVEPSDGIQWAEAVLGDILPPVIMQQVSAAVSEEGTGVRVTPSITKNGVKESLTFKVELTNAA